MKRLLIGLLLLAGCGRALAYPTAIQNPVGPTGPAGPASPQAAYAEMGIIAYDGGYALGDAGYLPVTLGWFAAQPGSGTTAQPDAGTIQVNVTGQYYITARFSVKSSTSNASLSFALFKNGVDIPENGATITTLPSNATVDMILSGLDAADAGDVYQLRAHSSTSPSPPFAISYANFSVFQVH